jgi:hypothetical protein
MAGYRIILGLVPGTGMTEKFARFSLRIASSFVFLAANPVYDIICR